jgi:4-aminobutyrate aminotransferase-like enzyme
MKAIRDKVSGVPLAHAYTFGTEIRYDFIKELVDSCYPKGKAFLVSAGTEATEVACKLMRYYTKKKIIISIAGCMHGRTMLTEQLKGDFTWADLTTNIWHLPCPKVGNSFKEDIFGFNDWDKVAGFIIESYQGWSATFYPKQWIQDLIKFAKEKNIPVCFDEIQGGFGRTGKMFAYEHYEIDKPDLICFGKGVSSSVPLSGVIGRKDIIDSVPVGSMSSTHSANPIACAAGLANILYIKKYKLVERSEKLGNSMINYLTDYLGLKVEGNGMLCAIHTINAKDADEIVMECFKRGLLLIRTHKESVKIAPPLTISSEALTEGLEIIGDVIKKK